MNIRGITTRRIERGNDLFSVFLESLTGEFFENSLVAITSKVVSLAENSLRSFSSEKEFLNIIREEADRILVEKEGFLLTEKDGILMPNAGVDRSNAPPGTALLLPRNAQKCADDFREKLRAHFGVTNCGVLIVDSRVVSRRLGISGVALAWSGFRGVSDERGKDDLFGKKLAVSQIAVADNLASMAQIFFGQAAERVPFVLFEKSETILFTEEKQDSRTAMVSAEDDLFYYKRKH